MAKKKTEEKDAFKSVESSLSRAENFIEENQKAFIYGIAGLLLVVLLVIGYYRFIREPRIKQSWAEAFKAEMYFERDSFNLALNGDGVYPGLLDIIDDYGRTPIGKASRYYAGVCYMRLGDYETAISHLKKFKSKDAMVSAMAIGLIGDAYMELGDLDKALDYYLDAAKKADNDLLSPIFLMKAGRTCELLNDYEKALELYKKIDKDYYDTPQQREIEKYITRAELKIEQNKK
ncbi:MAG: tetratricopeptide repeat protein [Bacteroidales bacterium]|jgi:tetratricopeptide (TPR) repeat protein|nr:tetratricopeptide repeat protein [Bacteroidales bacterium]HOL98934.1 tetratricopeptide repeat protein [Bacteroidales bacterium]HOM36884.1 tetratricopeptide repeat protein [Bacteroidales bacterium]HPD24204.1 tetratricopeptide repeat protein [Bacteroidales bacterium]HRS99889.1 tetratricopeptide repeat protein [Bacteroidales bacterium]